MTFGHCGHHQAEEQAQFIAQPRAVLFVTVFDVPEKLVGQALQSDQTRARDTVPKDGDYRLRSGSPVRRKRPLFPFFLPFQSFYLII